MPTKSNAQVKFRAFSFNVELITLRFHVERHAKNNKSHKIHARRVSLCRVKNMNHINSIMHAPLYPNIWRIYQCIPDRVVCLPANCLDILCSHEFYQWAPCSRSLYSNMHVLSFSLFLCVIRASLRFVAQQLMNVPYFLYRLLVANRINNNRKKKQKKRKLNQKKKKIYENSKPWRKVMKETKEAR